MIGKVFEVARVDVTETSRVACFVATNGRPIRVLVKSRTVGITARRVAS